MKSSFKNIFENIVKLDVINEEEEDMAYDMKGETFDLEKIYPDLVSPYFVDRTTIKKSTITKVGDMIFIMIPHITKFDFFPSEAIIFLKRKKMRLKGIQVIKGGMIIKIKINV